jgi:ABC-type Fe3+-hydroxamate transport system substrate-binding protein
VNVEAVVDLAPDLILANQEENGRKAIEQLCQRGFTVFISFPCTVAAAVAHLARLARMLRVEGEPVAKDLVRQGYALTQRLAPAANPVRAFVPIWADPLMTADGRTYLSSVLEAAGATNVFHDRPRLYPLAADLGRAAALPEESVVERDTRYPRITVDEVVARDPELVLFPDEPHPFTEADIAPFRALGITAAARGQLHTIPGNDLLWPGARTVEGVARIAAIVNAARG